MTYQDWHFDMQCMKRRHMFIFITCGHTDCFANIRREIFSEGKRPQWRQNFLFYSIQFVCIFLLGLFFPGSLAMSRSPYTVGFNICPLVFLPCHKYLAYAVVIFTTRVCMVSSSLSGCPYCLLFLQIFCLRSDFLQYRDKMWCGIMSNTVIWHGL